MTHDTKYDFGIPIPVPAGCSIERKTIENMPEGASYFFADADMKRINRIAARLTHAKFTSRKLREYGVNGVRVWRLP